MADQRITIGIGTSYSGEGMTKALKCTQQLSGAVTRSAGIVSAMAGTMGDLDTSAAKCMTAVAGFMQALSTGNPVVIGVTVAMIALSKVLGNQKEKLDELKKSADELKKSVDATFAKALTDSLSSAQKEAAALVADFDKITKSANAFTAALRGVQSSNDKGSIIQLQTDKLNAMIKAQADGGEALVAAEYDLLIAKEKAAQAQNAATADLAAATKAAADNEARTRKLEEARDKLIEEQSHLEVALLNSEGDARKKVSDALKKVADEQEKYSALIADNLDAQGVLEANVAKAKSDLANAERQAALETLTAQNSLDKLRKAEEEAKLKQIDAELRAADAANDAALAAEFAAQKSQSDAKAKIEEADAKAARPSSAAQSPRKAEQPERREPERRESPRKAEQPERREPERREPERRESPRKAEQPEVEVAKPAKPSGAANVSSPAPETADIDRRLADAKKRRADAELRAAQAAALNDQLKDAAAALVAAHNDTIAAENSYQAALGRFNDNIDRNLANERNNAELRRVAARGGAGRVLNGGFNKAQNAGDQQKAADVAVERGLKDGSIRNTVDLNNARKDAKRANRDYNSSQAAFRERRDAEEYAKLSSMSPKRMNQWQKNRLADLQKLKDAKDADAKNLAAAEQAKKDAQMKEAQMQSDVADIKALLSNRFGVN